MTRRPAKAETVEMPTAPAAKARNRRRSAIPRPGICLCSSGTAGVAARRRTRSAASPDPAATDATRTATTVDVSGSRAAAAAPISPKPANTAVPTCGRFPAAGPSRTPIAIEPMVTASRIAGLVIRPQRLDARLHDRTRRVVDYHIAHGKEEGRSSHDACGELAHAERHGHAQQPGNCVQHPTSFHTLPPYLRHRGLAVEGSSSLSCS